MLTAYDYLTRLALNLVDPYSDGPQTPPSDKAWPFIKAHLYPLRKVIVLSLLITVFTAGIEVWMISYAGQLIDMLAGTAPNEIWKNHSNSLMFAGFMLFFMRPLAKFIGHAVLDVGLDCNAANLVRWRAYEHLSKQSVGWFQDDLAGRTASRLVLLGNYATRVIYHMLNAVAFGTVYMIGLVIFMAQTDLRLSVPLFLWLALYVTLTGLIVPKIIAAMEDFMSAKSALLGKVVDVFSNFDTVSLYARDKDLKSDYYDALEHTRAKLFYSRQIKIAMSTLTIWLEGVIILGFVGYGIWLWANGHATIGLVSAAVALSLRITQMAGWVMEAVFSIFQEVGSVREALRSISQPLRIDYDPSAPMMSVTNGEISLQNVHHHYGKQKGGLNGVTLSIKAGEKVGLVGPSGAGKSTLVNLILRFYECEAGRITIDGQDVRHVNPESLRHSIGMVSQQAALLNRSVAENITIGQDGLTQNEIESAAKEASAHDFICDLADDQGRTGYATHVGERGVKLSGGQRQRIALARVILKNAPILILDEATSALDSEVEAEIQTALTQVMDKKTVIAIAHRLSTIAEMDRIIVLADGKIAEQGNHKALLDLDGLYAKLWRHQSGGFIDDA